MRLNGTNRRRALQRRRKLMPEPRRISTSKDTGTDSAILHEAPSTERPDVAHADLPSIEQPDQDHVLVQG